MFRRLLGLVILLVSLIMIALLLAGAFYTGQAVDAANESLDNILSLTTDTLANVAHTLEQTKATIVEANNALDTASTAAFNLSQTMSDMQPLLESTTTVVSEDVPANIEAVQSTIPNIAQVAGVIDGVLRRLSTFGISQTIPIPFNPITLEFDLGIDYAPEEPFDQSIWELGDSLEGMPEELRSLKGDLNVLTEDLEVLTANVETASGDIEKVNEEIALFLPIIDEYLIIMDQINDSVSALKSQMSSQLEMTKTALIALFVLLSLTQLAPLYLGWELITGQRFAASAQNDVVAALPPSDAEEKVVKDSPAESDLSESMEEKTTAFTTHGGDEPLEIDEVTIVDESRDYPGEMRADKAQVSAADIEESSPTPYGVNDENAS